MDIVEELEGSAKGWDECGPIYSGNGDMERRAASEITRLREENKVMREATDVSKAIAWAEKDGDEWIIHEANSQLGEHITKWQTREHYKTLFPVFARPALATTGGE